jgi:hypothetical protein
MSEFEIGDLMVYYDFDFFIIAVIKGKSKDTYICRSGKDFYWLHKDADIVLLEKGFGL